MTDPTRAQRLWLAIAVATLFLISLGGQAEANLLASSLPPELEMTSNVPFPNNPTPNPSQFSCDHHSPTRLLSCWRRGFLTLLASVIKQLPFPQTLLIPNFSPATG